MNNKMVLSGNMVLLTLLLLSASVILLPKTIALPEGIPARQFVVEPFLCAQDQSEIKSTGNFSVLCTPETVLVTARIFKYQVMIRILDSKIEQVAWLHP